MDASPDNRNEVEIASVGSGEDSHSDGCINNDVGEASGCCSQSDSMSESCPASRNEVEGA